LASARGAKCDRRGTHAAALERLGTLSEAIYALDDPITEGLNEL
jgi:hypothetical protein